MRIQKAVGSLGPERAVPFVTFVFPSRPSRRELFRFFPAGRQQGVDVPLRVLRVLRGAGF